MSIGRPEVRAARTAALLAGWLGACATVAASDMQRITGFEIDRTEVTVGAFRRFVDATGLVTVAEREGGLVYEAGWVHKPGWTWSSPYGRPAAEDEPAVHVTFAEAQAFCRWAGKRLPTDAQWVEAAYVEHRSDPPAPFVRGRRYPYPTGESPVGANCLGDCGPTRAVDHGARLLRGAGHARVATSVAGVNGLFDMGANVWEWVDEAVGAERGTRGGSWWYGAEQMREGPLASKSPEFAAVYIGFRCVR
jgi:formylglycine-generating enzyme required for sulfatase activity